jgi:flagellar motility protein MotE (MotC chaperone)
MKGKKTIIIMAAVAMVGFGASLGVGIVVTKGNVSAAKAKATSEPTTAPVAFEDKFRLAPKEKVLDDLIKECRLKIGETKLREGQLDDKEKRLLILDDTIKKEMQELENLQVQLVAPITGLKEEQAKLDKSRIRVAEEEKAGLKHTASIYEKMDVSAGSKIIEQMANGSEEDAVKILHYMSEKAAAKLLGEMPDKAIAGRLIEQMKRIREDG